MNGAASAAIAVETVLGDGPTLKGNKTDLVTRLAETIDADGKIVGHSIDGRTATVIDGAKITAETTGTPAAGIGTSLLLQAESQDEAPSDLVRIGGSFDDVTAASEDSRFIVWLCVAGAVLSRAFEFFATTTNKAIFKHSNTADRTYTLPNFSMPLGAVAEYFGPTSVGAGSNHSHEGTVTISSSQALSGIHYYTDFTLNAGQTLTLDDNSGHLCIVCTGTLTINGTIDGIGAGSAAGSTASIRERGPGHNGMSQPGGGGGGSTTFRGYNGGGVPGIMRGGNGGLLNVAGAAGTQITTPYFGHYGLLGGGASGGLGGSASIELTSSVGAGRGGGSINLIAPTVVLGSASVLNTSGAAGAGTSVADGAGGGGGAGNIYIACQSYTDNGCTFTMTGGAGGGTSGTGAAGGAGAAGLKQINIYP